MKPSRAPSVPPFRPAANGERMSIGPTKSTKKRHEQAEQPDVIDELFVILLELLPEIANYEEQARRRLRLHFGGEKHYIKKRDASTKVTTEDVLRLFNGQNATAVARVLGCSRPTVYRKLKQPGRT